MTMLPWVKVLAALLLIAAVLAAFYFYGQQQFGLGEKAERAAWLARENTGLASANAKIKTLEEKYLQQEHDAADAIAVISHHYQKDLHDVKAEKDHVIAGLRAGAFRLYIPVRVPDQKLFGAAAVPACGGAASEVAASACGRDAATLAELSVEASEFLVGLASEADEVAKQLGRCQDIIEADRNMGKED